MKYKRRHSRSRPRGWFSLFIRLGGWACLIFGVLLVVLTFFSASALYLADRMDADGRLAWAAVTDKRVGVTTDSDGDESRTYYVTFTYKTREGGRATEAEVPEALFRSLGIEDEHLILDPELTSRRWGPARPWNEFWVSPPSAEPAARVELFKRVEGGGAT